MIGLFVLSIAWKFRTHPQSLPERPRPTAPVKVLVLNGCGKTGLAGAFAEKLRRVAKDQVDVVNARNAPVMDHGRTVVIGHGEDTQWTLYLARLIGCDSTATVPQLETGIEVSIILGYDFESLLPGHGRWWETP